VLMELELSVTLLNKLAETIDKETPLGKRLSEHGLTNGRIVVPSRMFDSESLQQLHNLAEQEGDKGLIFQLTAIRNIREDEDKTVVPYLDMLVPALINYLSRDAIDGWLYKRNKDGVLLPWLIYSIEYIEPNEGRPYVVIDLLANTVRL